MESCKGRELEIFLTWREICFIELVFVFFTDCFVKHVFGSNLLISLRRMSFSVRVRRGEGEGRGGELHPIQDGGEQILKVPSQSSFRATELLKIGLCHFLVQKRKNWHNSPKRKKHLEFSI